MNFEKIIFLISILSMAGAVLLFQNHANLNAMLVEQITSEELILKEHMVKEHIPIVPATIRSKSSSSVNQPNGLNRVTYQPDFYYEEISDDIKQKINGFSYKEDATISYDDLRYVRVLHTDFENITQIGELICNKAIAQDIVEIFYQLHQAQYPIEQIRLIDEYNADDLLSMTDNNTSCFNYRVVEGTTTLSKHALGMALDINPFFNPYVSTKKGGLHVSPAESIYYADRSKEFSYKITKNDLCYQLFTEYDFTWGGSWKNSKDYQHFQKVLKKP